MRLDKRTRGLEYKYTLKSLDDVHQSFVSSRRSLITFNVRSDGELTQVTRHKEASKRGQVDQCMYSGIYLDYLKLGLQKHLVSASSNVVFVNQRYSHCQNNSAVSSMPDADGLRTMKTNIFSNYVSNIQRTKHLRRRIPN